MFTSRFFIVCFSFISATSVLVPAQVDYRDGRPWGQRVKEGPDAVVPGWFYNLGLTGIRVELVKEEPKALLVRHVFEGTPASGKVEVGDLITGVMGRPFVNPHRNGYGMKVFGGDGPVSELAEALEKCQGRLGAGQLVLMVKRGGESKEVGLEIGKSYGSYASTFPDRCPKSARILGELLEYVEGQQREDGSFGDPVHNTFACLALMGSGERSRLKAVERNLRHVCRTIDQTSERGHQYGLMNWTSMGAAITLSEYYLITKEDWVLPELRKIQILLERGQYMEMSQINPKSKESHPGSYPKGPESSRGGWGHNPGFEGYGPIAMITAQGAMSFALMHRCGIEIDRGRLDAAYAFLRRGTAANGYLWYGDGLGGGPDDWADMGRTGASGVAHFLSPYPEAVYRKQALLHSEVIGNHPESFPDTHGSPIMGMAYAALAANLDAGNFRKLMDENRWWFTMAQCPDKTFYYQPNRDNAGYGSDARMTASSVVAFIYTIPKGNLAITGRAAK